MVKRTGDTEVTMTREQALRTFVHADAQAVASFLEKAGDAFGTAEIELDQGDSAELTISIVSDEDYEAAEG